MIIALLKKKASAQRKETATNDAITKYKEASENKIHRHLQNLNSRLSLVTG